MTSTVRGAIFAVVGLIAFSGTVLAESFDGVRVKRAKLSPTAPRYQCRIVSITDVSYTNDADGPDLDVISTQSWSTKKGSDKIGTLAEIQVTRKGEKITRFSYKAKENSQDVEPGPLAILGGGAYDQGGIVAAHLVDSGGLYNDHQWILHLDLRTGFATVTSFLGPSVWVTTLVCR